MKTLILHHVEKQWNKSFNEIELIEDIINHLEENYYDKVILTTLESCGGYEELEFLINKEEEWSYGWEKECIDTLIKDYPEDYKENDFIEVSTLHEYAYVYDWIKDLEGEIYLAGGADGECLTDLEETLDFLEKPYKRIEKLIF